MLLRKSLALRLKSNSKYDIWDTAFSRNLSRGKKEDHILQPEILSTQFAPTIVKLHVSEINKSRAFKGFCRCSPPCSEKIQPNEQAISSIESGLKLVLSEFESEQKACDETCGERKERNHADNP